MPETREEGHTHARTHARTHREREREYYWVIQGRRERVQCFVRDWGRGGGEYFFVRGEGKNEFYCIRVVNYD